jgi:general secretion pathway protein F
MAAYFYRALDSQGKLSKGVMEGDSERQVRSQLRAKQLKPVAVSLSGKQTQSNERKHSAPRVRVSHADLTLFTRQLATLVQSNMPLDEALSAVAQQTRRASLKSLVLQVRSRVMEGHSLAYGLGDFPSVFNTMYCAMVKAGEHAGFLGQVLEQLADYTENSQYTRQKLKMAMIYPLVLIVVAIAMVALLMTFVVPELVSLFTHNAAELPWITQALITSSHFIRDWGWLLALLLVVGVVGFKQLLKAPARRRLWHRSLLKLPLIGGFLVAADSARFAATVSILVSSGVPLLDGLKIAAQVLSNWVLRDASLQVASSVQEGMSLNKALAKAEVFPPIMVHMVASGEASGEVETMLSRAAKNQERELEMALGTVMSIFEPAMILIMAALVGAIVVAILLPIIEMNNLVA